MENKPYKYFIFFCFSWLVYNSGIFVFIPLKHGFGESLYTIIEILLVKSFEAFIDVWGEDLSRLTQMSFSPERLLSIFIPLFIRLSAIVLWCRKQTIPRAWLLAFTGMNDYIPVEEGEPSLPSEDMGDVIIKLTVFFGCYYWLIILNMVRRECFPNNRFFNAIVAGIKLMCLRT